MLYFIAKKLVSNHLICFQFLSQNNESRSDTSEDLHCRALLRAIIGYLGTIEMPKHSTIDSIIIGNCIRRIRNENKVHTTILLAVYPESIILANIEGQIIAQFAAENLISCGICADDQNYFGLITTVFNEINCQNDSQQVRHESSYSCHVFVTTPTTHQVHYRTAIDFGIKCTLDPITSNCLEFPGLPK
jgi:regulator of G-protein signaling